MPCTALDGAHVPMALTGSRMDCPQAAKCIRSHNHSCPGRLHAVQVRGFRMGQKWVGIGCAAQLACILLFNALTVVFNRYMQRASRRWHGSPGLHGRPFDLFL